MDIAKHALPEHSEPMRITGGAARSVILKAPEFKGLRPSTDFLRELLFGWVASGFQGARVLDIFAGTGAFGLEALSRGASHVVFVEKENQLMDCLKRNIAAVEHSIEASGLALGSTQIMAADALHFVPKAQKFNWVLAGPPYPLLRERPELIVRAAQSCLLSGGRLALEYPGDFSVKLPANFKQLRRWDRGACQPSLIIGELQNAEL